MSALLSALFLCSGFQNPSSPFMEQNFNCAVDWNRSHTSYTYTYYDYEDRLRKEEQERVLIPMLLLLFIMTVIFAFLVGYADTGSVFKTLWAMLLTFWILSLLLSAINKATQSGEENENERGSESFW